VDNLDILQGVAIAILTDSLTRKMMAINIEVQMSRYPVDHGLDTENNLRIKLSNQKTTNKEVLAHPLVTL